MGSADEEKHNTRCRLQNLNMSYNNISSNDIVALSNCLKNNNMLQKLTISWSEDKFLLVLNNANKFCNMSSLHFGNVGAILTTAFIFQKDRIQYLDISVNDISYDGAVAISEYLKVNNALIVLNMSNNNITSQGIIRIAEAIQMNTTLRLLDISHNNISRCREVEAALSHHLKYNNTLQVIKISWSDIDTTYVYNIGVSNKCYVDNTGLQSEWVNRTVHYVHEYDFEEFNHRPQFLTDTLTVRKHKLQFSDTEAILLTALVHGNVEVKTFEIMRSEISSRAAIIISDFFKTNKTLQNLKLSQNTVSSEAIKQIINAIQTNITLQILDISSNNIPDDGAVAISECLKNNNTLKELNMSYNEVSNIGIINISKALQINTTLQILDISHNNISDDGVIAIGEALRSHQMIFTKEKVYIEDNVLNGGLQKLNMSSNNISSEGIIALSSCLKSNKAFQEIVASWDNNKFSVVLNNINKFCDRSKKHLGDAGIILISAIFSQTYRIHMLNISHNNISYYGAVAISEYLRATKTLQELNVSHNDITNEGIVKIAEAIQMNTTLRLLDISHNNVSRSRKVVTALSDHLRHNNTLQILGISWNNNYIMYVYAVGINNTCYVGNTWPHCQNIKHYVHEYNYEEFDHWLQFEWSFSDYDTVYKQKLQFSNTEAILLTALVYGNVNVTTIKIVGNKISDSAAITISDFLKVNKILEKLELSQNIISSEAIK